MKNVFFYISTIFFLISCDNTNKETEISEDDPGIVEGISDKKQTSGNDSQKTIEPLEEYNKYSGVWLSNNGKDTLIIKHLDGENVAVWKTVADNYNPHKLVCRDKDAGLVSDYYGAGNVSISVEGDYLSFSIDPFAEFQSVHDEFQLIKKFENREEKEIGNNYPSLIEGVWQSTEDIKSFLIFKDGLRISRYMADGSLENMGSEPYMLADACQNEGDENNGIPESKNGFISEIKDDMCWAILELTEENLSLAYMGRGNTLNYSRVSGPQKDKLLATVETTNLALPPSLENIMKHNDKLSAEAMLAILQKDTTNCYGWTNSNENVDFILGTEVFYSFSGSNFLYIQGNDGEATMWEGNWSLNGDQMTLQFEYYSASGDQIIIDTTVTAFLNGSYFIMGNRVYERYCPT